MTHRPVGFGIVGLGLIAAYHARAIREARGAALIGVAGRSEEKARRFAAEAGAAFATGEVEKLAARPDIQVISITTPSGAHLEPALAAIRAGKHLLIEKPLEITVERVDRILEAAEKAGVTVAGVFQGRFGPGARALKAAVEGGRFGRIALASVDLKLRRAPEYYRESWHGTLALDGGGALINQGIHGVDLLQWVAGMPSEVFGWKTRRVHTGIEAEDTVAAALKFGNGALGSIEATTAAFPGWRRRIEICGETGSAQLEDDEITRWDFAAKLPGDEELVRSTVATGLGGGASSPSQISHQGHLIQIQDLVDALGEGRAPLVDGREARKSVAIVRAIYESAESGRVVRL